MSSYTVIGAASKVVKQILWDAIKADSQVRPLVGNEAGIVFLNPTDTAKDSANRLSLWLYRITENEFVKNQPMLRGASVDTQQFPPLALNLYYLLTPFTAQPEGDHLVLGKAMQVMHDHATTVLIDPVNDVAEELHIVMCRLTLEELGRVWEALQEPYRLSICYEVRVTRIDSDRVPALARVVEMDTSYQPSSTEETG